MEKKLEKVLQAGLRAEAILAKQIPKGFSKEYVVQDGLLGKRNGDDLERAEVNQELKSNIIQLRQTKRFLEEQMEVYNEKIKKQRKTLSELQIISKDTFNEKDPNIIESDDNKPEMQCLDEFKTEALNLLNILYPTKKSEQDASDSESSDDDDNDGSEQFWKTFLEHPKKMKLTNERTERIAELLISAGLASRTEKHKIIKIC